MVLNAADVNSPEDLEETPYVMNLCIPPTHTGVHLVITIVHHLLRKECVFKGIPFTSDEHVDVDTLEEILALGYTRAPLTVVVKCQRSLDALEGFLAKQEGGVNKWVSLTGASRPTPGTTTPCFSIVSAKSKIMIHSDTPSQNK